MKNPDLYQLYFNIVDVLRWQKFIANRLHNALRMDIERFDNNRNSRTNISWNGMNIYAVLILMKLSYEKLKPNFPMELHSSEFDEPIEALENILNRNSTDPAAP